jgi:heme-degrading monooxygenase HmoA
MTPNPAIATKETEIRTDVDLVTQIGFLHCDDAKQDAVVVKATALAKAMRRSDGNIAVNVLRSKDGSRVCFYNQWRDAEAAEAAERDIGSPDWGGAVEDVSGGLRLYDVVYANDLSTGGVSIIGAAYLGTIFINEIRTLPDKQDRLLELVIANNEDFAFKTPGYRSANFHKSRDGERAVNYSLWDSEDHLIDAISDMAAGEVNLEETIAIANPDFRFYTLAYADHA